MPGCLGWEVKFRAHETSPEKAGKAHLEDGVAVRHVLLEQQRGLQPAASARKLLQALGAAQQRQLVRSLCDCISVRGVSLSLNKVPLQQL